MLFPRPALGSPIERFTRHMFTHIIQKLSAFVAQENFSISEVAALHLIGEGEGLAVQAIAAELQLSLSATSRLISGLVDRGLLLRRADSRDARARVVTCSKSGLRLLDQMSLERVSAIFEIAQKLPSQIPEQIMSAIARYGKDC